MPKVRPLTKEKLIAYKEDAFCAWIRKQMRVQNLTQEELTQSMQQEGLDMSQQTLSHRLTGRTSFSMPELISIFDCLGAEPEDIAHFLTLRN